MSKALTMYDSVTPTDIPTKAQIVLAYVDGGYANEAAIRSRFAHGHVVTVTVRGLPGADVIDRETGDVTADEAALWAAREIRFGRRPTIYMNASSWPDVKAAVKKHISLLKRRKVQYLVAEYDNDPTIPQGAIGKQYADPKTSGGHFDLSVVSPKWSALPKTLSKPRSLSLAARLSFRHARNYSNRRVAKGGHQLTATAEKTTATTITALQRLEHKKPISLATLPTIVSQGSVAIAAPDVETAALHGLVVTLDDDQTARVHVDGHVVVTAPLDGAPRHAKPRQAGGRGRAPKKPVGERFAIAYLHDYLINPLPAPTYPVDVTGGITDWQMLGNGPDPTCTTHPDGVGDCTFAGRQHYRMAKAAAGHEVEKWETANQLVAEYLKYDHGQDEGANIADLLLDWYKAGVIAAFAPVDHTKPALVDSAMAAFRGVYFGVNLTDDADQRFEDGKSWTVSQGQRPDPDDGHCIVKVKATKTADGYVTWGAEQGATKGWTKACSDEAWVIITKEDAHLVNLAALVADIEALHGTGG